MSRREACLFAAVLCASIAGIILLFAWIEWWIDHPRGGTTLTVVALLTGAVTLYRIAVRGGRP